MPRFVAQAVVALSTLAFVIFIHAAAMAAAGPGMLVAKPSITYITSPSPGVEAETSALVAWRPPDDLDGSTSIDHYEIGWSAVAPVDSVEGWWTAPSTSVVTSGLQTPTTPGTEGSHVVGGLQAATTYHFAVRLVDSSGGSSISDIVSYMTATPPQPSSIGDLVATIGDSATSVLLTWSSPSLPGDGGSGSSGSYDVRYRLGSTFTDEDWAGAVEASDEPNASATAGDPQSFTVSGLQAGASYAFAVKTIGPVGTWSSISNIAVFSSVDTTPPGQVLLDAATGPTPASSVTLQWNAPAENGAAGGAAASYAIAYSTLAPAVSTPGLTDEQILQAWTAWWAAPSTTVVSSGLPVPATPGQAQSHVVGGLAADTTWHFGLKAVDAAGNASHSTPATRSTQDPDAPNAISNLAAVLVAGSDTSLQVSWTAPYDNGSSSAGNLAPPAAFDLRYRGGSSFDEALWSAVKTQQVPGEPAPGPQGTTHSMIVTGLLPATDYVFAIRTTDESGNLSAMSNLALRRTPDYTAPDAVVDLQVQSTGSDHVALSWSAPGDNGAAAMTVAAYELRYSLSPISDPTWSMATPTAGTLPTPEITGTVQTTTVGGLLPGTTYYFAIRSRDGGLPANVSGLSNVVSTRTLDVQTAGSDEGSGGGGGCTGSASLGGAWLLLLLFAARRSC